VEIDGDSHYLDEGIKKNDRDRQKYIEDLGFTVLRFTNDEISKNIDGVLTIVVEDLK